MGLGFVLVNINILTLEAKTISMLTMYMYLKIFRNAAWTVANKIRFDTFNIEVRIFTL